MSGVVKSVKKIFKPVVKYAPLVLGAAALVFTAGAALDVPGTAGGWGGAVTKLTQSLGAGDTLTNTLSGALTQAGYGAVLGAAVSAVSGGDFVKGAQYGAAGGAITGGLMGGFGGQYDPLAGIGQPAPSETAAIGPSTSMDLPPPGLDQSAVDAGVREGQWGVTKPIGMPVYGGGAASTATGAATAAGTGGGLFSPGGWVERNQNLVGYAAQGLGQGLMSMAQGDDYSRAGELALKRDREQRAYIAGNYGSGDVPGYRKVAAPSGNPTPSQRFDPATYNYRWEYDAQQGRLVKVPDQ